MQLNQRRAARTAMLLLLLLLTLPAVVQAQFNYTTNNGAITITGYTGSGGAVDIPNTINGLPVTSIGDFVFQNCTALTNVMIPNSVTNIGFSAFFGCSSLTSVTIGNGVTSVGNSAFRYCTSLTAITVDALNPVFSSVDGVLFNKSQTTLIKFPEHHADSYTISNSVTSIEDSAFHDSTSLTNITIPDSVTNIGNNAFGGCTSLTSITIGNSVTSIGDWAFYECTKLTSVKIPNSVTYIGQMTFANSALTSVTIPNSVTNIGDWAFALCTSLTSVMIGNGVTSIGVLVFQGCASLTNVMIGNSVTNIGNGAFQDCHSLTGVHFNGNAPSLGGSSVFTGDGQATVYYLAGTTGWGATFGGLPTALWNPPAIQTAPQTQTAEAGSAIGLRVNASGSSPLFCVWYVNSTNLLTCSTNRELELTNVQFAQSGAYSVVVSNALGAVTSSPAMLNVIAPVERRPVPGVRVTGEAASLLNLDYADFLSPAPNWTALGSISLTSTSQYCLDLTLPLPPQRFYRAWQTGTPGVIPSLDLHLVPAITLTGSIGYSLRLDYINQFGPIDAWVTLDTVTLTNTSQLYFDVSAPGHPQRFYRLVPWP